MTKRTVPVSHHDSQRVSKAARTLATSHFWHAHDVADDNVSSSKKVFYTIITSDLLIPGDGEPIHRGAVVIESKTIAWVGEKDELPSKFSDAPHRSQHVPYLMPGLWDAHVHVEAHSQDPEQLPSIMVLGDLTEHPVATGARLAKECWDAIQLGYTSMRDCGGYGCEMAKVIDDGSIIGPNIYSAGSYLSQTAGHGDTFGLPPGDVILNLGVRTVAPGYGATGVSCLADGVDEVRRAVRLQIRRGAKCIKVMASGGVTSRDDDPLRAQFSKDELTAIVEEATRLGAAVAAHVHGKPGIIAALEAGVTTVEHATFADDDCIALMKEKGVIYVATRAIIALVLETGGEGIPKSTWEKVLLINEAHLRAYKAAIKAGVTIALGTDSPPGFPKAKELQFAVEAGMSNLEAIKAATATGPLTLKENAPKSGQLKVGYDADVLGVLENPTADVKVLQDIKNIAWVWKGGRLLKGPGVGPWGEDES